MCSANADDGDDDDAFDAEEFDDLVNSAVRRLTCVL